MTISRGKGAATMGSGDWGRDTIKTPTSIDEFIAEVVDDTVPEISLAELEANLGLSETQDVDPEKMEIDYNGQRRTVTSVVRIMKAEGSADSAEILEGLIKAGKTAKELVAVARKKATGSFTRPILRKAPQQ
jgi:hypothetical protein